MLARQESDAIYFAKNIKEGIVPIFFVSNLRVDSLDLLRRFLSVLPYPETFGTTNNEKALFLTHHKFQIDGKIVFTGFLHKGVIRKHQRLYVGPMVDGSFQWGYQDRRRFGNPLLQNFGGAGGGRSDLLHRRQVERQVGGAEDREPGQVQNHPG